MERRCAQHKLTPQSLRKGNSHLGGQLQQAQALQKDHQMHPSEVEFLMYLFLI